METQLRRRRKPTWNRRLRICSSRPRPRPPRRRGAQVGDPTGLSAASRRPASELFLRRFPVPLFPGRDSSSPAGVVNGMKVVKLSFPRVESVSRLQHSQIWMLPPFLMLSFCVSLTSGCFWFCSCNRRSRRRRKKRSGLLRLLWPKWRTSRWTRSTIRRWFPPRRRRASKTNPSRWERRSSSGLPVLKR